MPRVRTGAVLRALLLIALFAAWLQLMLSATHRDSGQAYQVYVADVQVETVDYDSLTLDEIIKRTPDDGTPFEEELLNSNETSEQVLALVPQELHKFLNVRHRNASYGVANSSAGEASSRSAQQPRNISEMRREMARYNDAQAVLNEELFGPVLNDTVIIAIQVHTRLTYLRHLIVSLAQARSIDKTLLVFSHDYFDDSINALVQSIDFARVLQIFYPYSIQTHPHEFPGVDPNDCPRNAKFEDAVKLQCNNALHPDGHGHYREAKYAQTKHHWWWKANRIFNQLRATRDHTGYVVFLEEDHYVAEDFLHVLKLMQETAERKCPYCEILCLGTYLKTYQYHVNSDKVEITPWHSSVHNMGMAFNRTVWKSMMALSDQFCLYDDYNWDYSLLHLSQNRPAQEKFKVMVCKGPRVFHIGECGFHHKKSNCDTNAVVSKVARLLRGARAQLYPGRLVAAVAAGGVKAARRLRKGNGGWGDVRDHELCTNMTKEGRDPPRYSNLN